MTTADVLDGAFTLIKARPAKVLGLTLALVAPIQVLLAFLQRDALGSSSTLETFFGQSGLATSNEEAQNAMISGVWIVLIAAVGNGLVLVAVAAMIAAMLSSWVAGHDLRATQMLWVACRHSWALVVSWVIVHLAEAASLLGIYVGVLFAMPLFLVVAPAIGAERIGPLAAVARSTRLCTRQYWWVMLWALLMAVVGTMVSLAVSAIPSLAAAVIGYETAWPLLAVGGTLGTTFETAFVAAGTVLVYLNLRIRSEGIDLELSAREVFAEPSPSAPMVRS